MKKISESSLYIMIRFIINIVMLCMSLFTFCIALVGIIEDIDIEGVYFMIFDSLVLVFCLIYTKHTIEMICREFIKNFKDEKR